MMERKENSVSLKRASIPILYSLRCEVEFKENKNICQTTNTHNYK